MHPRQVWNVSKITTGFDRLELQSVVSWNASVSRQLRNANAKEALKCLQQMQYMGVHLNASTFIYMLKTCSTLGSIQEGVEIHAEIARTDFHEKSLILGNMLVDMYAKLGLLGRSQEVFDNLLFRDIVSWTTLIAAHSKHGCAMGALKHFEQMQYEGVHPNAVTFVSCLKACAGSRTSEKGRQIHAKIAERGYLENKLILGNALIDMYAKCGLMVEAQNVFDELPIHDVVSWTALISGYAKYQNGEAALKCFEAMQLKGVSANSVTYLCCLTACGKIEDIEKGREIHSDIVQKGLMEGDLSVANALVDMYACCGSLSEAEDVFHTLPVRDIITWNSLISGYVKHDRGKEALECFSQMQHEGLIPDVSTLVCGLKACACLGDVYEGLQIHAEISRKSLSERNVVVGSALIDMYIKCGLLSKAQEVFNNLSVRDLISWNALILGYARNERGREALQYFETMLNEDVSPDAVTYAAALKACGSAGDIDKGKELHIEMAKQGVLENDLVLASTLVDMYSKCGLLGHAQEVFDRLMTRDTATWTALLAGYANHEFGRQALDCFDKMQQDGCVPNAVTYVCAIKACSSIGAVNICTEIHSEIARKGLLKTDVTIGTAIAGTYAKIGLVEKSWEVFDKLPVRDANSWNTMISGHALNVCSMHVQCLFEKMQVEGVIPDAGTFVSLLSMCCHVGLLNEGQMYFEIMSKCYGIDPMLEHYCCMLTLFARLGRLDMAIETIKKMPFSPNIVAWDTLLDACQKWGNMEVGEFTFERPGDFVAC